MAKINTNNKASGTESDVDDEGVDEEVITHLLTFSKQKLAKSIMSSEDEYSHKIKSEKKS